MALRIVRPGPAALPRLAALEPAGFAAESRQRLLATRLLEGEAFVAEAEGGSIGYALRSRFFGYDFLELLFVEPVRRRQGVASALISSVEGARRGERLFVSTNRSNAPMRTLLAGAGYKPSGEVVNLDPGDPELFFVKRFDSVAPEPWS